MLLYVIDRLGGLHSEKTVTEVLKIPSEAVGRDAKWESD